MTSGDVERLRQIADVLFEPLALIGQREPGAGGRRRLRDRPRDRALVGDTDDEAVLSGEIRHGDDWRHRLQLRIAGFATAER